MQNWLLARANVTPYRQALIFEEESWTYRDLYRLSIRIASGLTVRGIGPGDRVGVLLESSAAYVGLVHACTMVGAVLVPLNTRLTEAELAWQIEFVEPVLMVVGAGESRDVGASVRRIPVEHLVEDADGGGDFVPRPIDLNEILAIVFTSGTTGRPKGAMLTYGNFFHGANSSAYRSGLDAEDLWLSCLPLYHVGGLAVVFRSCLYGTAIDLHRRFDVAVYWQTLLEGRVTLTSLVPTMLHRLLSAQGARTWPDSLRLILLGGAAASEQLLERSRLAELPVATTYGLTEASSQVATARPADVLKKPGSVGKPLLFAEIKVVEEGCARPAEEVGEIWARGPQVMAGYFRNPEATAQTLVNGWLRTGDMGYLDRDGDLFLVQRRSDIIISGGENIYPAEVEAALRRHSGVVEACVVGVDDPEWGQRVAALVQTGDGQPLNVTDLTNFLRQHLAGYKLPRQIAFTPALPQTASGKIERRRVAALLGEPLDEPVDKPDRVE